MKQILKNIKRKCLGSLIECCGYIISQGDKRIKVMPCKNMAIHPHLRFEIGPYDTIEAFEEGDIIYHSIPNKKKDPQEYSALASKIAFKSLIMKIKNKTLFKTKTRKQNKKIIIRKAKKTEFTHYY